MKRVKIISNTFVPGAREGQMRPLYVGTVLDVDDDIAVNLIVGHRAVGVADDEKLADTTKAHEAAQAAAAERASQPPELALAAAVAAAVEAALARQAKATAPTA